MCLFMLDEATQKIKILTNHISDQRPCLVGYSKQSHRKIAYFVTYFPVVTETNWLNIFVIRNARWRYCFG